MIRALVAIWILCLFDAVATLWWVGRGGEELNPLMAMWLSCGAGVFLLGKMSMTTAGLASLAKVHRTGPHPLLNIGAAILLVTYIGMTLFHCYGFYVWSCR